MADLSQDVQKQEADPTRKVELTRQMNVYTPAVDIMERKDDIVLLADMPGVDETSVEITLEKNVLTIYGKVAAEIPSGYTLYLSEYGTGDYQRVFTLTEEVDRDKIQATVKNGVLTLVLPKAEAVKTRKIEVKGEA
jgi:HSP20 family protein